MSNESYFSITLYYFEDEERQKLIPGLIMAALEESGLSQPKYVRDKKFTGFRNRIPEPDLMTWLTKAYLAEENYNIYLQYAGANNSYKNKCDIVFWHSFHGDKGIESNGRRRWIRIQIVCSYDLLNNSEQREKLSKCVFAMIEHIRPVYATADDMQTEMTIRSDIRGQLGVIHMNEYMNVNSISWGNYFGSEYCRKYGLNERTDIPAKKISVGDGIFFMMTDSPFDYDSEQCLENRRKTARFFNIVPPNEHYR